MLLSLARSLNKKKKEKENLEKLFRLLATKFKMKKARESVFGEKSQTNWSIKCCCLGDNTCIDFFSMS